MRPARDVLAAFEALPETPDDTMIGEQPLILAPHPDDESLGCGGLIAAACAAGRPPVVAILTDGAASHPGSRAYPPPALARLRQAEALRAVAILGLPPERLVFLDFADAEMPKQGAAFDAAAARLSALAKEQDCGAVIGPWACDPHCDHEAGAALAAAVAAASGLPLRSYPVWGWLLPPEHLLEEPRKGGWRFMMTGWLEAKRQALAAHESQYGALITDAPNGFELPAALLAACVRGHEVFIAP